MPKRGLAAAVLLLLWACSATNNSSDSISDASTVDLGLPETMAQELSIADDGPPPCPGMGDLTGAAFTVFELFATAPTDAFNEIWAQYLADHDLVVIFRVLSHDVSAGVLKMEVTSAWADKKVGEDGIVEAVKYRFALEPGGLTAQLNGCEFLVEDEFELDLVVPKINQPFHIYRATGDGWFSDDGTKIEQLNLSGFLLEGEAADTCLAIPGLGIANLRWFLNLAGICPDSDVDEDGQVDSYNFLGVVRAEDKREMFADGLHPIQSEVDECITDTGVCTPAPQGD
jgi:hypothetical protein